MLTKRYGHIRIPRIYLDDYPKEVIRMLSGTIPVRAEQMFVDDSIEYILLCEEFDMVAPGENCPHYEVVFSDDGHTWSGFRRVGYK